MKTSPFRDNPIVPLTFTYTNTSYHNVNLLKKSATKYIFILFTYLVSVDSNRNAKGPGQPEISNLDAACLVNEKVLGLQVSAKFWIFNSVSDPDSGSF